MSPVPCSSRAPRGRRRWAPAAPRPRRWPACAARAACPSRSPVRSSSSAVSSQRRAASTPVASAARSAPPRGPVGRRFGREALVDLAEGDVGGAGAQRQPPRRGDAAAEASPSEIEQRLAHQIVGLLGRIGAPCVATGADPASTQGVAIAAGARRALAQVVGQRELGIGLGGAAEEGVALVGVAGLGQAHRGLHQEHRRAAPAFERLGVVGEDLGGALAVGVGGRRAGRGLASGVDAEHVRELVARPTRSRRRPRRSARRRGRARARAPSPRASRRWRGRSCAAGPGPRRRAPG